VQPLRGITVKSALSTPPRALGTISLAAGVLTVGWKMGSGINAKFLKFGVPDASNAGPANYRWDKIVWTPALARQWADARWPAQDGWVIWARQTCCNYSPRDWWYNPECVASPYGFVPPEPFAIGGPVWSGSTCYNPAPPGYTDAFVYYASAPENALGAPGPIEPYTNQPYTYSKPAPTPPPQTTVEQSIMSSPSPKTASSANGSTTSSSPPERKTHSESSRRTQTSSSSTLIGTSTITENSSSLRTRISASTGATPPTLLSVGRTGQIVTRPSCAVAVSETTRQTSTGTPNVARGSS
jgi:hypothetical protein